MPCETDLKRFVTQQLADEAVTVLDVQNDGEQIVGYAVAVEEERDAYPFKFPLHLIKLDQLAIDRDFEGQGHGSALVEEVETIARRVGATEIQLSAWNVNKRAISLYKWLGFMV